MKLSTKGRYGTRILLDVAAHGGETPIPLRDIADRQQIPLPYLERLVASLVLGGILTSRRGIGGGVSLARSPKNIKVSEIIRLLEGSITLVNCVTDRKTCSRSASCVTRNVWDDIEQAICRVLESYTLQDLVDRQSN
jgi:Rrf2 family protein